MATFKDIEKANSTIKTMKIARWDKKLGMEVSKDYAEVNQRIKAFRMLYPEGFIKTRILSHEDGVVVMQTDAGYIDEHGAERILGTGMAFEDKKNGLINGTSYIENCETSAVGRALGMIGLGIDMSIASFEEVNNAIAQQEAKVATSEPETAEQKPPRKAPTKQAQKQSQQKEETCDRCGQIITDAEGQPAAKIIRETKRQFKHAYCMNCAHEAAREAAALAFPTEI